MIIKLEVGMLETNCYLFKDDETGEGMVIDPGDDALSIMDNINANNINVKYIVLTHGHWDHIGALDRIKHHTNAEVLIHEKDEECLNDSTKSLSYMFGISSPSVKADKLLKDGDEIQIGKTKFEVIHTPGHTVGGISLLSDGILFSGDTIFRGTTGRTDLPGGNVDELMGSIKSKILTLDEKTNIYPGHGDKTTVGKEKPNF